MSAAAQRAPKADANLAGSGVGRRGSQTLKGRRGSGVEKLESHVSIIKNKMSKSTEPVCSQR